MTSSHDETERLLALTRFIQKIHQQMNAGLSQEALFDFIFNSLGLIIPFDRIGIAILVTEGNERKLLSKWVKSKLPVQHLKAKYSASIENSSLRRIIDVGEPRIIGDLEQYLATHPQSESTRLALKDGIRSSLTCPLKADNRPVGVVFFSSAQPNTFRPEHADIVLEIAGELSLIVEQNRLRSVSQTVASKDQSLRMALHDLRSPLGVMQGYINVALEEEWFSDLNDDAKSIFATLNRNAHYMSDLINELAELIQLDRGIATIHFKPIDLNELIVELSENGKLLSEKKEIAFNTEIAEGLPSEIHCDRVKIIRAITNLFTNAIKYSNRKTTITFSIKRDQNALTFSVTDQGLGIPEKEFSKLFSEFGKTSVRPTEGESSSGLGLAIVRKIVSQHNGKVAVQSRVGQGSTFTVSLPI